MSEGNGHVTGVDFVTLPTQDFDGARQFYGELLGLPFVKQWGDMPGAEYQAGNLTLAVMDPTAFGQDFRPSSSAVALQVEDVAAVRERLESEGIDFQGDTMDSGVCHMAFFADRDGNPLILHHRYAPKDARPG